MTPAQTPAQTPQPTTAPMSDKRLAEIRRSLNRGPLTRGEALDLMAEIDNLKDKLAARPEPAQTPVPNLENAIGYALLNETGGLRSVPKTASPAASLKYRLAAEPNYDWKLVALVPVDAP